MSRYTYIYIYINIARSIPTSVQSPRLLSVKIDMLRCFHCAGSVLTCYSFFHFTCIRVPIGCYVPRVIRSIYVYVNDVRVSPTVRSASIVVWISSSMSLFIVYYVDVRLSSYTWLSLSSVFHLLYTAKTLPYA